MINRRAIVRGLAVTGALPLASCFGDEQVKRRIKVIATARVDGKTVEGSSVYELTWRASGERMYMNFEGEAVLLELAGRGTVYVLPASYFPEKRNVTFDGVFHVQQSMGFIYPLKKHELPIVESWQGRHSYKNFEGKLDPPLMVAFKNEQDFRSIYRVEPTEFSTYFGTDVEFVSVEFEFTDEPVTKGVLIKRLPMLGQPARDIPLEQSREPDGRPLSAFNTPFNYKIAPKHFFWLGEK